MKTTVQLFFDLHPAPKGYITFNMLRRRHRLGIKPRRIGILLPIHFQRVIACRAFPRTSGVGRTLFEILIFERGGREIDISFNKFVFVGFGDDNAIPKGAWHGGLGNCGGKTMC